MVKKVIDFLISKKTTQLDIDLKPYGYIVNVLNEDLADLKLGGPLDQGWNWEAFAHNFRVMNKFDLEGISTANSSGLREFASNDVFDEKNVQIYNVSEELFHCLTMTPSIVDGFDVRSFFEDFNCVNPKETHANEHVLVDLSTIDSEMKLRSLIATLECRICSKKLEISSRVNDEFIKELWSFRLRWLKAYERKHSISKN
ncbi:MAG: hypothetical protein EOP48_00475 [Sphingobacteriales bacterium]|nr:MAG: hypothetical protein EOP48_00475 [Sphingobacteriales bacterium]